MSKRKFVVDTSALIRQEVSKLIESGMIKKGDKIIVPSVVILELEHQANSGNIVGLIGFEELDKVKKLSENAGIEVEYYPVGDVKEEILKLGKKGSIDAIIREVALKEKAILVTADKILSISAKAIGLDIIYVSKAIESRFKIESLFDEKTLSVHLKVGCKPLAKKGKPGSFKLEEISNEIFVEEDFNDIVSQIMSKVMRGEAIIESKRKYSIVVQMGLYRIIIIWPPLSEVPEITIVKPLVRRSIWDYNLPKSVISRLIQKAEGILISGPPGSGKSTFCQALAEFYKENEKIIKTIEHPRDLHLPSEITQYSKNYAKIDQLYELLLLSRPDYTIFDEMRTDEDFKLYMDLRLAGIGMIGVIHASSPIDAIHRFIHRVDLGELPSIIDTVLFINRGEVEKVYDLSLTVKVPTGLRDVDLARPVVEVRDFINGKLEYEIYTFGEQTVVIPVKKVEKKRKKKKKRK